MKAFDVIQIRQDFPALHQQMHAHPLAYLDNAATTQKPQTVVDATIAYYTQHCANVHRGAYALSEKATALYDGTREKVQRFLGARSSHEIVFTHGNTESLNMVAQCYGGHILKAGDEVIVSGMEHHSSIVPWQMVCEKTGAKLKVLAVEDDASLSLQTLEKLLSKRTKIVAITHVSNALGTINPIKEIAALVHAKGAVLVVDGAQAVPHMQVDVQALDVDFYTFGAHKLFGPTGLGILYGKSHLLETMPPYQGGGDMITQVSFEKTAYQKAPLKFEAGTTNIAGVIGLGAALDYLARIDLKGAFAHEAALLAYASEEILRVPSLRILGHAADKVPVLSFAIKGVHAHDISSIVDRYGIAIRGGHLCAQPLMKRFGVPAFARASFAFYNTFEEVDRLVQALVKVCEVMHVG